MNLNDANRIHDAAPDDAECITSLLDDDFLFIAQLTQKEKRELLEWWFNRNQWPSACS